MRGLSVSSVCRSMGTPASPAASRQMPTAPSGSGSRCGQPPATSAPSLSACRRSCPACPAIGLDTSATSCTSTRPRQRSRTSISAVEGPHAHRAADVHVRTDACRAEREMNADRLLRARDDVLAREGAGDALHRLDGAEQVAGRVRRARRGQRLVQVRVRLGERRHQHLAGQVLVAGEARSRRGDDLRDQAAGQLDVDQFSRDGPRGPEPAHAGHCVIRLGRRSRAVPQASPASTGMFITPTRCCRIVDRAFRR